MIYSVSIFVFLKDAHFMVGILHVINFYSYSFLNMRVPVYSFVFFNIF